MSFSTKNPRWTSRETPFSKTSRSRPCDVLLVPTLLPLNLREKRALALLDEKRHVLAGSDLAQPDLDFDVAERAALILVDEAALNDARVILAEARRANLRDEVVELALREHGASPESKSDALAEIDREHHSHAGLVFVVR